MGIMETLLIGLVTMLVTALTTKAINDKKNNSLTTKITDMEKVMIRIDTHLAEFKNLKDNDEEIFNRLRNIEIDLGVVKEQIKNKH